MLLHFTRWETASLRRCLRILIECLLIITSFPLTLERPWSWLGLVLLEINLEKGMGWCDQTDSGKFVQAEGWILVNREDATLGGRDVEANFVGRHPETKEGIFFFFCRLLSRLCFSCYGSMLHICMKPTNNDSWFIQAFSCVFNSAVVSNFIYEITSNATRSNMLHTYLGKPFLLMWKWSQK